MVQQNTSLKRLTTLIVGGGGFIGSHLVYQLAEKGNRNIVVVGRKPVPKFPLPSDVSYIQGDIGAVSFIGALLENCDEVVDFAYATVPKTSFDDPVHDVLSNLPLSVVLLKQASIRKLRRFVLVSSGGTVYGNSDYLPIDEKQPTNPISPYGITKLASEKYALMYHHMTGLPAVIVRPSNPYGPGQFGKQTQGFIGAAIYSVFTGKKIPLFGERGTIRDYIHIDDLCRGIVAALNCGTPGGIYNIGTGIGHDNLDVLDKLAEIAEPKGFKVEVETYPKRPFDVKANVLSSERLTLVSGWRANITLEDGLRGTWDWAFLRGAKL